MFLPATAIVLTVVLTVSAFPTNGTSASSPSRIEGRGCSPATTQASVGGYIGASRTANGQWTDSKAKWHDTNAYETLINWMWAAGRTDYKNDILTSYQANWGPGDFGSNGSHDDALWVTLLYFKINEWLEALGTPDESWFNKGVTLLKWAATDLQKGCPGGLWWEQNPEDFKNAITNELYISAASKAYLKTRDQQYLNDAVGVYNFMVTYQFQKSDGLYVDGMHDKDGTTCTSNGAIWTYNQGVILSGLGQLYQATGDVKYLNSALTGLDAVIARMSQGGVLAENCDISGTACDIDQAGFKGLFMRHLQYFLDAVNHGDLNAKYGPWIGLTARAMNQYARRADAEVGTVWYQASSPRAIYSLFSLTSGIDALLASSKYGTTC